VRMVSRHTSRAPSASRRITALATLAAVVSVTALGDAARGPATVQEPSAPAAEPAAAARPADDVERGAIAFAAEHHPELVPLLEQLRASAGREFAAAIAELDKSRTRLERIRERQPDRYPAALAEWRVSSRIRLVLARLATAPSPEAERELRDLVRERAELRLAPLRAEQARIGERLAKISAQIEAYDRDPEGAVARECDVLEARFVRPDRRDAPRPASPAP